MRHAIPVLASCLLIAACGSDPAAGDTEAPPATTAAASPAAATPSPSTAPAVSGRTMTKDELGREVCFFTAAEVRDALGIAVAEGKPANSMAAYGMFTCSYDGKLDGLQLNAIWVDPANVAASRGTMTSVSAGQIDRIAGDPDGAYLQYQGEIGGALHYMRGNVMIELRPAIWGKDNAAMKAKLLRLRRVP